MILVSSTYVVIGFKYGTVIYKKRLTGPAPSMSAASYMEAGKSCKLAKYMVVYMGIVDQIFIAIMTFSANAGSCRKLMPYSATCSFKSAPLMGPLTLNINIKIMVSAELEVSVGRKYTVRKKYFPLILLFNTDDITSAMIVCTGTTTTENIRVFFRPILAISSVKTLL